MGVAFIYLAIWYVLLVGSLIAAYYSNVLLCLTLVLLTAVPFGVLFARLVRRNPTIGDAGDAFVYYTAHMMMLIYFANAIMLFG